MPWNYSRSVSIWQRPHSIWFSRGYVECSFGQVCLIFVVLATLCFKNRAHVFTRRLKAKLLPWPLYPLSGQIMVQLTTTREKKKEMARSHPLGDLNQFFTNQDLVLIALPDTREIEHEAFNRTFPRKLFFLDTLRCLAR